MSKVQLEISAEDLEALKYRLFKEKYEGAFAEEAVKLARFRATWRTAEELQAEFGIPERTLRHLHGERLVGKSAGVSPRHPFYFRPDVLRLIEEGHVKSKASVAALAQKVTVFEVPRGEARKAG